MARRFDPPVHDWLPGHRGVDLVGAPGGVVRAAGAGVVTFAGILAGRGVVTVTHGELRTTYEPLDVDITRGQRVGPGTPLGRLDLGHGDPEPGRALLHWGLRRGDVYLDPLRLLGQGPVRLLPRWTGTTGPSGGGEPVVVRRALAAPSPAAVAPHRREADGRPRAGAAVIAAMTGLVGAEAVRRRRRPR